MAWYGQINRTLWEIERELEKKPDSFKLRRELLRCHFLQRYEFDKAFRVARDDRSFLFLHDGPSPVCLLLHGAQGTPAEMREMGNFLYSRGYTVYCPRFPRVDFKDRLVSWQSWATSAEGALAMAQRYSREAFVVGLSLGATLGMILAGRHKFRGAVFLAPAVYPRYQPKDLAYLVVHRLAPDLFFRFAGWNGEVLKAMEYLRRNPPKILMPALALQAKDDIRLSLRGLKFVRRYLLHPQSQVTILPRGSHALTRGVAKGEVFQRAHRFLETIRPG